MKFDRHIPVDYWVNVVIHNQEGKVVRRIH